jgi:arylsulfatase A-like enzyme
MEGVYGILTRLPSPFFAYLHFMPPHAPYTPKREYLNLFNDGWIPPAKKEHRFSDKVREDSLQTNWQTYDEFIANIDADLGKLLNALENAGRMEDSYILITSDHGELFERGIMGHTTEVMYQRLVQIPLIIHAPGQSAPRSVHSPTSNIDLLPTLCHIAGIPIPDLCEGQPLPALGGEEEPDRTIYMLEAKRNPAYQIIKTGTIGMVTGHYKLVHYFGYQESRNKYEFYDLSDDPEELNDLSSIHPLAKAMRRELDQKLEQINSPRK